MIGKTLLHYHITAKLGEGGMGVVYRAEDTKLDRPVALKFLSGSLLGGDDDRARFKREARAAAALNHPNIATIYAIEEVDSDLFIVMEYIDGKPLNDLLRAGGGTPLPLDTVVDYATQIAAGMQAAHEKGIIHRDIKAGNIMITEKGRVKVMDFGLAKFADRTRMTRQGSTVGTAAYMSPEQARGEEVDHRSDIWSLGVVLYEMVSGRLPFRGDYEQAAIYSILNEDPEPLTALRTGVPLAWDGIIAKALAKDPAVRYQHVDELPADLKAIGAGGSSPHSRIAPASRMAPAAASPTTAPPRRKMPWVVAALVGVNVLVALVFLMQKDPGSGQTMRLNIAPLTSKTQQISRTDVPAVAISPDGTRLAFSMTEDGVTRLFVRLLNSFEATPLDGTTSATAPFFSPDGRWIGFLADGILKRVPAAGGAVEILADAPGFRGASWGPDDAIIFSPEFRSGLSRIPASGGAVKVVSRIDSTRGERSYRWPQVLPDGDWMLYTIGDENSPNSYIDAELALQSLKTGERHILNVRGEMARYVAPGYLIVARNGALLAAPFSLKEFKTTQPLQPVLDDVAGDPGSGISYFDVSRTGALVYIAGGGNAERELVWVDLDGKVEPFPLPPGAYSVPRISPDGTKLAVTIGRTYGTDNDIWVFDLKSGVFNRFTFGRSMWNPVWSRDSRQLYFASGQAGARGVMVKPVDGSRNEEIIFPSDRPLYPISSSVDGRELILDFVGGAGDSDIFTIDLQEKGEPRNLFNSAAYEYGGMISPDGRFITYGSNEIGRLEAFVSSYPDLAGKWQISTSGGRDPTWSPDGRAIYFISNQGKMMATPVQTNPAFSLGHTRELFDVTRMVIPNDPTPNWDISPDGKRFIMIRNTGFNSSTTKFNVILNWGAELDRQFGQVK